MAVSPLFPARPVPVQAPGGDLHGLRGSQPWAAPAAAQGLLQGASPAATPGATPEGRLGVPPTPEQLHPALWRAHQLGRAADAAAASGYPVLDAQLPGGGWPARTLTELLLPHPGVGELRLLAPVLVALQRQQRCLMWFDPPAAPCAWALSALGLDMRQLVVVQSRSGRRAAPGARAGTVPLQGRARELLPAADMLWALEHALKSGHLGAVLAWLPARLPADALRRLQLAAQAHEGPVFLLRDLACRTRPSPAPLRLLLSCAGPDLLRVSLLKRRGPPLVQPLVLELPPALSEPALARAWQAVQADAEAAQAAGQRTVVR